MMIMHVIVVIIVLAIVGGWASRIATRKNADSARARVVQQRQPGRLAKRTSRKRTSKITCHLKKCAMVKQ